MPVTPPGAELNLALQGIAVGLLLVGLWAGIRTHREMRAPTPAAPPSSESLHKNVMTAAVGVSAMGVIVWMIPNLLSGWYYTSTGLGYGTGGYDSYFTLSGAALPHAYLLWIHIPLGALVLGLAVYLVVRMRWAKFPPRLAVRNFRALMIVTWVLWIVNFAIGLAVFYYFAYVQTG
ncbi:MAG: DUF420 domain-containing protein [Thermoplasmata archaeon]|nr:DUF420 domain-containing protein [Thermoplasmata archaeon]MCI4344187.1 DUF420 domain-containing protein [Thermoplasmata archaeon]